MSRRVGVAAAVVISLAAVWSLAGCSAGGLPGSPGGSGSNTSASQAPGSGGSNPSGGSFTLPKTCLSAAVVSATLGIPAYGPTVSSDSTSLICSYETASKDGPIVAILPSKGLTASNFKSSLLSGQNTGATATSVSGVGDAALILNFSNGKAMDVLAGGFDINIAGLSASDAQLTALAKKILAE
ncbi:MAG TPA: hypothetical protein VHX87_06525 [Galbitalea sp.]|jgi:hypothetical protein|nr:hypothetical protein [Galbitalea sp.]